MSTLVKGKFAVITVTAVLILWVTSQIALVAASAAYEDEFASGSLQSCWTVTAGTGSYSLIAHSGYLRLTAPNGAKLSTISGSNLNAPRVLQPVTGNINEATTYVTGSFTTINYRGGLLLWFNNQNFIRLEKYGPSQVLMYPIIGGNEVLPKVAAIDTVGTTSTSLYLKFTKTDNTITGYYSGNGVSWTSVAQYTISSSDTPQIGLFAINADSSSSSFNADFDYFHIIPSSVPSVLPEYPVGVFGAAAAIAGAYVFFKFKSKIHPAANF